MGKAIDLTGKRYGRLIAVEKVKNPNDKHHAYWKCKCDCGNFIITRKDSLENGHTKSCGCISAEKGYHNHGYSHEKLFSIYYGMKYRCYNPNCDSYSLYGGRGIKVCDEWLKNVENFINWAYKNGYDNKKTKAEQSLDRIDVNGNYEPSNCRWADKDVQNYNKRCTRKIVINGEEKTLLDLHKEYEISMTTLRSRYQRYLKGLCTVDELIQNTKIINKPQQIIIRVGEEEHNLTEWEKITGTSRKTIIHRYRKGARTYEELFKKGR